MSIGVKNVKTAKGSKISNKFNKSHEEEIKIRVKSCDWIIKKVKENPELHQDSEILSRTQKERNDLIEEFPEYFI